MLRWVSWLGKRGVMAKTVAQSFDDFKAKLVLTEQQQELVKGRQVSAAGYLLDGFGPDSDMPECRDLYLPLSSDGERVDMILGLVEFDMSQPMMPL